MTKKNFQKTSDSTRVSFHYDTKIVGTFAPEGWNAPAITFSEGNKKKAILINQDNQGYWLALLSYDDRGKVGINTGMDSSNDWTYVRVSQDEAKELLKSPVHEKSGTIIQDDEELSIQKIKDKFI